MVQTKEEKALIKRQNNLISQKACEKFKVCVICKQGLKVKTIAKVTLNLCKPCAKTNLDSNDVLKYCIECTETKSLVNFKILKNGFEPLCNACNNDDTPEGMKKCINNLECVDPEGPNLPDSEEYFSPGKNQCRVCKNKKSQSKAKDRLGKFLGLDCKKCGGQITEENDNRQECTNCYKFRKTKKYTHTPSDTENYKDSMRNIWKSCTGCGFSKHITDYKLRTDLGTLEYRSKCKLCCSSKQTLESIRKFREATKNDTQECIECGETKNVENFRLDYDKVSLGYRAKCVYCSNKLGEESRKEYTDLYYSNPIGIYDVYRMSAKCKNLDFDEELIMNLIQSSCEYCGKEVKHGDMDFKIKGSYNGIDRIDNFGGYVKNNVLACCSMCNYMKHDTDISSFIRKCCEIYKVEPDDFRLQYHNDKVLVGKSYDYGQYRSTAKNKHYSFELSKEQFIGIVAKNCFYCNKTNKQGVIGIDRVDNNIGYNIRNCVPCCNYCNYMKRDYDISDFLNKVEKIVKYTKDNEKIIKLCKDNNKFHRNFERAFKSKISK